MAKLTANTHGYEFELMNGVIIQYDGGELAGRAYVTSFEIVFKSGVGDQCHALKEAFERFYSEHDDLSVELACIDHFVNKVF